MQAEEKARDEAGQRIKALEARLTRETDNEARAAADEVRRKAEDRRVAVTERVQREAEEHVRLAAEQARREALAAASDAAEAA